MRACVPWYLLGVLACACVTVVFGTVPDRYCTAWNVTLSLGISTTLPSSNQKGERSFPHSSHRTASWCTKNRRNIVTSSVGGLWEVGTIGESLVNGMDLFPKLDSKF